jgi:hypothetical protein
LEHLEAWPAVGENDERPVWMDGDPSRIDVFR